MDSRDSVDRAPVYRVVLRRIMRLASDYGGIPLLIAVFGGLIALMVWCLSLAWSGTSEWIGAIDDPTERGLAYIAAAIVFHALAVLWGSDGDKRGAVKALEDVLEKR